MSKYFWAYSVDSNPWASISVWQVFKSTFRSRCLEIPCQLYIRHDGRSVASKPSALFVVVIVNRVLTVSYYDLTHRGITWLMLHSPGHEKGMNQSARFGNSGTPIHLLYNVLRWEENLEKIYMSIGEHAKLYIESNPSSGSTPGAATEYHLLPHAVYVERKYMMIMKIEKISTFGSYATWEVFV